MSQRSEEVEMRLQSSAEAGGRNQSLLYTFPTTRHSKPFADLNLSPGVENRFITHPPRPRLSGTESRAAVLTQSRWYCRPRGEAGSRLKLGPGPEGRGFEACVEGSGFQSGRQLFRGRSRCTRERGPRALTPHANADGT